MIPASLFALAAALLAAAPPQPAHASRAAANAAYAQASLEVTVRGAGGQALAGAVVRLGERPAATTDSAGRARVPGVAAGEYTVSVTHASLGTRTARVTLPADAGSLELSPAAGDGALAATVRHAVAVAGVTATAQRNPALETLGFYRRQEVNPGQYVTEEEIQSRRAGRLTDVLRRLKGVRIIRYSPETGMNAGNRSTTDLEGHNRIASARGSTGISRAGPCWMDVYIDGSLVQSADVLDAAQNLDQVSTSNVIGVEVYHASEIPSEYRGGTSTCGVVLIWTKH
jgi:hypothetical protein